MKMETAAETLRFGAGVKLKLTADQHKTRSHVLKELGDGVYETTGHVEFKRGEKYGLIEGVARPPEKFDVKTLKPAVAATGKGKKAG